MSYVSLPLRVLAFLDQDYSDPALLALAEEHTAVVTSLAQEYTRRQGFIDGVPAPGIAAVIVTATARMLSNPMQLPHDVGGTSIRGGFVGWSLIEATVLNGYRRRAA